MRNYDVIILTDSEHLENPDRDKLIQNAIDEDKFVQKALEKAGYTTLRISWDDTEFNWSSARYTLFRTTWDYFDRYKEFSSWLNKVSKETLLLNSENIIRWNIDKHYLLDLQKKGIHICESYFIEKGGKTTLADIALQHKLKEFIIKPCISASGRHTYKINPKNSAEYEDVFARLISNEAMIVQPLQHNIIEKGEISLVVINGTFTHAVLKVPKKGDFRVQDNFGGAAYQYTPTKNEIDFAEKAVRACIEMPIYARVDVFTDNNGTLALAELELIEPELWFRLYPEAADELAKGIKQLIN